MFSITNDILFNIIKSYEEKEGKISNFITNFTPDIQKILNRRISFINHDSKSVLYQIDNAIKTKDSWSLIKILILNKYKWANIKQQYEKAYNTKMNFACIFNKEVLDLYENIIEFNYSVAPIRDNTIYQRDLHSVFIYIQY